MRYEEICRNADDPAVLAAEAARDAEVAFAGLRPRRLLDEFRTELRRAEADWVDACEAFADVVPTTPLGALAKLRALTRLLRDLEITDDSLEARHVQALIAYVRIVLLQTVH